MTERRPPARAEKRIPRSVRYTDTEWARFTADALDRGLEVTKWVRQCSIAGAGFIKAQESLEEHRRASA